MAWPNKVRTECGVVHAPGLSTALACRGRISSYKSNNVSDDVPVTCLWCISGMADDNLRWFKWGDGS